MTCAAAGVAVAGLGGATSAAATPSPLAGIYRGTLRNTSAPNPTEGCFTQKPTVYGKRVKPASGAGTICEDQIIAPSLGPLVGAKRGCNVVPAVLDTGGFPIQKASFHYTGRAPIGPGGRILGIDFKGRWLERTRVVGRTTIWGDSCESTTRWTMIMSAPPPWP